jgi:hypothetical protein
MGWMDLNLVGQQSRALVAFVPPVSIKDRSLHGPWSSHRFIVPSIYLLMGAGRLVSLLSWVPALSGPAFRVVIYIGLRRSKHHTEAGPAVMGA